MLGEVNHWVFEDLSLKRDIVKETLEIFKSVLQRINLVDSHFSFTLHACSYIALRLQDDSKNGHLLLQNALMLGLISVNSQHAHGADVSGVDMRLSTLSVHHVPRLQSTNDTERKVLPIDFSATIGTRNPSKP